ncbi:hypothetical protein PYCC9005_005403 [Savitreella phatthalungensis]
MLLPIDRALAALDKRAADFDSASFVKRQFGYGYGYGRNYNSGWYNYGRWILLGVIVGVAVLFWLFLCGCNRRRTRQGMGPVRYTGWATPGFTHPQQSGVTSRGQYPMNTTQTYNGYNNNNTGYAQPNQTYANQTYYNAPASAPPGYAAPQNTAAVPAREK